MKSKAINILAIIAITTCACLSSHASNSAKKNNELNYIIDGIHHFRTTLPDTAVEIIFNSNMQKVLHGDPLANDDQKMYEQDAPNLSSANIYWITQGDDISFDVDLLGNRQADKGDSVWMMLRHRLVRNNGQISTIHLYRKRKRISGSKYTEQSAWSGNINLDPKIMNNGYWNEEYMVDPRYFMYFVDDKPLDELLTDRANSARIAGNEFVNSANCTHIIMSKSVYAGKKRGALRTDCWVDIKHGFIIRKARMLVNWFTGAKSELFMQSDEIGLVRLGSAWFPQIFTQNTYPNSESVMGSKPNVITQHVRFTAIPSNYDIVKSPFAIKWPGGAYVYDIPGNKRYIISKKGKFKQITK